MKTNIIILTLFLFSFSLISSPHSQDLIINQSAEKVLIHHGIVTNNGLTVYIEIEISVRAWAKHQSHDDHLAFCIDFVCPLPHVHR